MGSDTDIVETPEKSFRMIDMRGTDWNDTPSRGAAGVRVTPESSLQCATVLACVRLIAENLATVPIHVYRRLGGGGKERATDLPLYKMLTQAPNGWQTSFEFREMMTAHCCCWGNAYAEIRSGRDGPATELWPLHPSRMRIKQLDDGTLCYYYREDLGGEVFYRQDQIFHLRWLSQDGVNGIVPITLSKNAIALAQALETHGSSYFGNACRLSGIMTTDNPINVENAERLREQFERMHRGADRAFRTAVLPQGVKWQDTQSSNEAAQFLETRAFEIIEICRAFRVNPIYVQDLSRSTYSNQEQGAIDLVGQTLMPWFRRWESAITRDLIADDDNYFAEFDVKGMLRGDSSARAAYYTSMMNCGVLSVNEIRAAENLNPIGPEGDQHYMQLNITTLDKVGVTQPAAPAAPAAAPPQQIGRSVESRALTISIDFDQTFSADPKMWGEFAMKSDAEGNTVVMISRRPDTPVNQKEIADTIGVHMHAFKKIMLIGADALKADAAVAAGLKVDIWIDDAPQTVQG